jgi:hypothetical protein
VIGPQAMALVVNDATGLPLKYLSSKELNSAVLDIISEISLVTGAPLHEKDLLKQQVKAISMFLWTGYGELKKSEISFAFTLNCQNAFPEKFRHYNKEINLEYLGDVLHAFIEYKETTFKKHEKLIYEVLKPEINDLDAWKTLIDADYQLVKIGQLKGIFYAEEKYKVMRKLGFIRAISVANFISWMKFTCEVHKDIFHSINVNAFDDNISTVVKEFDKYGARGFSYFIGYVRFTIYLSCLRNRAKIDVKLFAD